LTESTAFLDSRSEPIVGSARPGRPGSAGSNTAAARHGLHGRLSVPRAPRHRLPSRAWATPGRARRAAAAASTIDRPGATLYSTVSSRRALSGSSSWTTRLTVSWCACCRVARYPRDYAVPWRSRSPPRFSPNVAVTSDRGVSPLVRIVASVSTFSANSRASDLRGPGSRRTSPLSIIAPPYHAPSTAQPGRHASEQQRRGSGSSCGQAQHVVPPGQRERTCPRWSPEGDRRRRSPNAFWPTLATAGVGAAGRKTHAVFAQLDPPQLDVNKIHKTFTPPASISTCPSQLAGQNEWAGGQHESRLPAMPPLSAHPNNLDPTLLGVELCSAARVHCARDRGLASQRRRSG
jgi:hypothetical protein